MCTPSSSAARKPVFPRLVADTAVMTRPRGGRATKPPAALPDPVTVRIEYTGADGDGIGSQSDGSRLYVPLTVPGDRVLVRPTARRGDGWAAEIEAFEEHGTGRATPVCGHFGLCGGCTSQHWNEPDYLAWKTGRLAAALRRAGFDEPAIAPIVRGSPGTRRRMDLAARRGSGGLTLGLHRARGGEIVDLTECAVLDPTLFALIGPFRAILSGLTAIRREASVVANLLDSGPDILLRTDGDLTTPDRTKLTDFARAHDLPRISWAFGTQTPEAVCVLRPPVTSLSGVTIVPPAGAFLQATRDGEAAIIAAVLDGLPTKRPARARALELFAGCGTISFALADRIRVTAFEGDAALVGACHNGANQAGLMGKVDIRLRDLARQPVLANELAPFTVVVLDPPHAGAPAQMPHIAKARVPTVIYVSCDPVALGRDAGILRAAGYRLARVTPVDQFLWSARLEATAVFRLGP
jgi:23S rRNA (uracil1939-C5)-methyltransferase